MSSTWRLVLLVAVITAASATCPSSEWKQFLDKCYWASNYTLTWQEAKNVCRSFTGADMVSVHDPVLNNFIYADVINGNTWLGFRRFDDDAPWLWTDGSVNDYTNWSGGDPAWTGEGCAIIYGSSGQWTGYDCDDDYYFFQCQVGEA